MWTRRGIGLTQIVAEEIVILLRERGTLHHQARTVMVIGEILLHQTVTRHLINPTRQTPDGNPIEAWLKQGITITT